jgi:hypothetical protein
MNCPAVLYVPVRPVLPDGVMTWRIHTHAVKMVSTVLRGDAVEKSGVHQAGLLQLTILALVTIRNPVLVGTIH